MELGLSKSTNRMLFGQMSSIGGRLGHISATVPSAAGTVALGHASPTCEPASRDAAAGTVRASVAANENNPISRRQRTLDMAFLPSSFALCDAASESYRQSQETATRR